MGIFTTTNRAVRMHGWTLPAGTPVQVVGLWQTDGMQQPQASCTTQASEYGVGLPVSALSDRQVVLSSFDVDAI